MTSPILSVRGPSPMWPPYVFIVIRPDQYSCGELNVMLKGSPRPIETLSSSDLSIASTSAEKLNLDRTWKIPVQSTVAAESQRVHKRV